LTRDQFDGLTELVASLKVPAKRNGEPDGRWQAALDAVVALMRAHDFRGLAASSFFVKMRRGESYYEPEMPTEFTEAAERVEPHLRKALVADVARQFEGALAVLPSASEALDRLQRERGIYGFGDIGRGVARAASRAGSRVADPASLRAALGGDVRDLAIDEAQDTSVEQFLSLRPLLAEVLSGARGGRFLLVGDPKQSIYGWRGGTPGLIAHIERDHAHQLGAGESLTRSFRSSPLVMDVVNRVFGDLACDLLHFVEAAQKEDLVGLTDWVRERGLPPDATESAFKRAVHAWPFARHESAKPKLAGRMTAYAYGTPETTPETRTAVKRDAKAAEKDDPAESGRADTPPKEISACACAAAIAARLHRASPGRSVGILTRTNAEVTETIAELKALGVSASDEGRATLLDSPAVVRVMALLRLIDDPRDRISHFLVSRGAMRAVTGLTPLEQHPDLKAADRAAQEFAALQRACIADEGLAAFLQRALDGLRAQGLSGRDASRLARVVAIAEGLAERPSARLVDFIDAVAADKADSSSSDKVRVMTMHKSKGLEFDEVVLASIDEGWGAAPTDWGMLCTSPTDPPTMVAPLANESIRRWVPELAIFERDERRRGLLDDLSTLYVALTRARQGVHLVMKPKQGGKLPTAAKLIVRAIDRATEAQVGDALAGAPLFAPALAHAEPNAEQPFWSHDFGVIETTVAERGRLPGSHQADEPDSSGAVGTAVNQPVTQPAIQPVIRVVPRHGTRAASPSTHARESLWPFDPFENTDTALRGVLVHECFRVVDSGAALESASVRESILGRAARRAAVEKGEPVPVEVMDDVRLLLARVAQGPLALELRSGEGPDGTTIEVRTELPFVVASENLASDGSRGDGSLMHGRIDRLELVKRGGRIVGAVIIDFKTGAVDSTGDQLERKQRDYFEQLEGYARAVSSMYGVPAGAIELKLLFVDRGTVARRPSGEGSGALRKTT
ncbi:MAG: ATP-dependent helicase/nuclease subunit, partial [Planctomycetota bacterium]